MPLSNNQNIIINESLPTNPESNKLLTNINNLSCPINILKDIFKGKDIQEILPINDGYSTSKIIKFKIDDKFYVMRLLENSRSSYFYISLSNEIHCTLAAHNQGISPCIYYTSLHDGIVIMDYINNRYINSQERYQDEVYVNLANLLRSIHNGEPFPPSHEAFDEIRFEAMEIGYNQLPQIAINLLDKIYPLEEILKKHIIPSPCHKDLHFNNILYDGNNIYVIDWETAGHGDPILDVATIAVYFIFDQKKESVFLKQYFGKSPTRYQLAHFYIMKQVCLVFHALKIIRRVSDANKLLYANANSLPNFTDFTLSILNKTIKYKDNDYIKYAYILLNTVLNNINSAQYSAALKTLK